MAGTASVEILEFCWFFQVQGIEIIHTNINQLIENFGYLGIFLAMFIQGIVILFPAYLIMPWVGYSASGGELNILGVIFSGFFGAYVSTILYYEIGLRVNKFTFGDQSSNNNFFLKFSSTAYRKSKVWFDRFGGFAVFWCRFLPLARTMISFVAGVEDMPRKKFHLLTIAGTFLYTAVLTLSGYVLKENWMRAGNYTTPIAKFFLPIFILLIAWYALILIHRFLLKIRQRFRHRIQVRPQNRFLNS